MPRGGEVTEWWRVGSLGRAGRRHISTTGPPRGTGSPPSHSTAFYAQNGYPQGPGGGTTLPWWPVPFGDHRRVARGCVSNVHRFRRGVHRSTPNRALMPMVVFSGRGVIRCARYRGCSPGLGSWTCSTADCSRRQHLFDPQHPL